MDEFIPHIFFIKTIVWKGLVFGATWQFLRWCILTRWLVKTIEHWLGYLVKLCVEQLIRFLGFAGNFIIEKSIRFIIEIWKYRVGKIVLSLLGVYLTYIIIYSF